jgi:hypothetical protein
LDVLAKPDEQSETCFSYVMARKRRMKSNVFVKPDEQSELAQTLPWRENAHEYEVKKLNV